MKAKTKIKTLLLGVTLATAFAAVGAVGLSTEYDLFNTTTITADAASAPYSGTAVTPIKITADNYAQFGFADASYKGYYAIRTAEELYGFRSLGNTASAVLTQDIVVNTTVSASGATHPWSPLYSSSKPASMYKGTFDGNGYSISGLYITHGSEGTGFFGTMSGGAIRNLTIKNSYISSTSGAGTLVGHMYGGSVTNCRIESTVTVTSSGNASVGGIVGSLTKSGSVSNCMSAATVSAPKANGNVGSVVGQRVGDTTTSNNYYISGTASYAYGTAGAGDGVSATALTSATATHTCVSVTHKAVAAPANTAGFPNTPTA